MKRSILVLTVLALIAAGAFLWQQRTPDFNPAQAQEANHLLDAVSTEGDFLVVELFTSQGCSSCPPADRFLSVLATRPDIIALSFHVDYWDYIGWQDPFADAAYTQRQRDYGRRLSLRYVYTPQMVVDGRFDAVGSNWSDVIGLLQNARAQEKPVAVTALDGGAPGFHLSARPGFSGWADLWVVVFDPAHSTDVARGENRGRTLVNANVVTDLRHLGTFAGEDMDVPIAMTPAQLANAAGCALMVQDRETGEILGAARLDING